MFTGIKVAVPASLDAIRDVNIERERHLSIVCELSYRQ